MDFEKATDKAQEPTSLAVTPRALDRFAEVKTPNHSTYCCTSRASEGRSSSLTLGKLFP
jgi:hypothetical protein